MTPQEKVKAALEDFTKLHCTEHSGSPEDLGDDIGFEPEQLHEFVNANYKTIQTALKVLDALVREDDLTGLVKPRWGDKIVFRHTNQWGDLCGNIYEYTYAGTQGKYPHGLYRFARCGDASIAPDSFEDIFIDKNDCVVGEKKILGMIQSYTRTTDALVKQFMEDKT